MAKIVYVDSNAASNGNGTSGSPYSSLDLALAGELAANANLVPLGGLDIMCRGGEDINSAGQAITTTVSASFTTADNARIRLLVDTGHKMAFGVWDSTKYHLHYNGSTNALTVLAKYVEVAIPILISRGSGDANTELVAVRCAAAAGVAALVWIHDCILRANISAPQTLGVHRAIQFATNNTLGIAYINNVLCHGWIGPASAGRGVSIEGGWDVTAFYVSVANSTSGFRSQGGGVAALVKNCEATTTIGSGNCFFGTTGFASGSSNNASLDTTAPGSFSLANTTTTRVDPANQDYRPVAGSAIQGAGVSLHTDPELPIITDILGNPRPQSGGTTIGYLELAAAATTWPLQVSGTMALAGDIPVLAATFVAGPASGMLMAAVLSNVLIPAPTGPTTFQHTVTGGLALSGAVASVLNTPDTWPVTVTGGLAMSGAVDFRKFPAAAGGGPCRRAIVVVS